MKQELGNLMAEDPQQETINLLTYRINSLTSELTEARAEIERLDVSGIHTCHDKCQRWTCVMRRELKAVTEQRDRLAEALKGADECLEMANFSKYEYTRRMINEALQSLTMNPPTSEKL